MNLDIGEVSYWFSFADSKQSGAVRQEKRLGVFPNLILSST
jgi:hypothetical protein